MSNNIQDASNCMNYEIDVWMVRYWQILESNYRYAIRKHI